MNLIEVIVSFLIMTAGIGAAGEAWFVGISQISQVRAMEAADLCGDNAAEMVTSTPTLSAGTVTTKESSQNGSTCTIKVRGDTVSGRDWGEIVAASGSIQERLYVRTGSHL